MRDRENFPGLSFFLCLALATVGERKFTLSLCHLSRFRLEIEVQEQAFLFFGADRGKRYPTIAPWRSHFCYD